MHAIDGFAFHHPEQKLLADFRQYGIGQDRVYHPASVFKFRAAAGDEFDRFVVVAERNAVAFGDTLLDAAQLYRERCASLRSAHPTWLKAGFGRPFGRLQHPKIVVRLVWLLIFNVFLPDFICYISNTVTQYPLAHRCCPQ